MATVVLTDVSVTVDGNDISDHVNSITLEYSADEVDDTHFGDDTHIMMGGLKNWSVSLEASQDFAAGELDSILFPLVGTQVAFVGKPTSGSVSTSNPSYSGTVLVAGFNPLQGGVGDKAKTPINLKAASSLSRATA